MSSSDARDLRAAVVETSAGRLTVAPEERVEHQRTFELPPAKLVEMIELLAEDWDGVWQPRGAYAGRLGLPVVAGLRRGWQAGEVTVERHETDGVPGSRLTYRVDAGELLVDKRSVSILAVSAAGGLAAMLIPFFPRLMPLLAVSIVLALCGWLLVVVRLRNSGAEDFLDQLASVVEIEAAGPAGLSDDDRPTSDLD